MKSTTAKFQNPFRGHAIGNAYNVKQTGVAIRGELVAHLKIVSLNT
jgi:hypothetical protein